MSPIKSHTSCFGTSRLSNIHPEFIPHHVAKFCIRLLNRFRTKKVAPCDMPPRVPPRPKWDARRENRKASTSAPRDLNVPVPVPVSEPPDLISPSPESGTHSTRAASAEPSPPSAARLRELFEAAPQPPRAQGIKHHLAKWFDRLRPQAARPQA
jgi:hypothetical protein